MRSKEMATCIADLDKIQNTLQDYLLSEDELTDLVSQVETEQSNEQWESFLEPLFEANHYLSAPPSMLLGLPLGDIVRLLKDVYRGKMNDHLQEILSNAEVEVSVLDKADGDATEQKELDIHIKLSATAIDRYSELLKMALGQKNLSHDEETIIKASHDALIKHNQRLTHIVDSKHEHLKRMNMSYGIQNLSQQINTERLDAKHKSCLPFFSLSKSKKRIDALAFLFNDLKDQPLTSDEMAGGLWLVKSQMTCISNRDVCDSLSATMDMILGMNHYTPAIEASCVQAFVKRADLLNLRWPAPFSIDTSHSAHLDAVV